MQSRKNVVDAGLLTARCRSILLSIGQRRRQFRHLRLLAHPLVGEEPRHGIGEAGIRDQVRAFVLANPNMPNRDIGRVFNIDGGRVSEILHGLR